MGVLLALLRILYRGHITLLRMEATMQTSNLKRIDYRTYQTRDGYVVSQLKDGWIAYLPPNGEYDDYHGHLTARWRSEGHNRRGEALRAVARHRRTGR